MVSSASRVTTSDMSSSYEPKAPFTNRAILVVLQVVRLAVVLGVLLELLMPSAIVRNITYEGMSSESNSSSSIRISSGSRGTSGSSSMCSHQIHTMECLRSHTQ